MMKVNIFGIIAIGIIITMIFGAGCSTKYSPTIEISLGGGTQTTTPTEVPTTDSGIVKAGF